MDTLPIPAISRKGNPSSSSLAASILSYLTLAGGLGTIGAVAYLMVHSYTCLPFWDLWSVSIFLAGPRRSVLEWLWAQHNEHRILLSKILLLLDYRLFHAMDVFPLCCIFLAQLMLLSVLLYAFATIGKLRGGAWRAAAGISAVCLFSTAQWENFVSGFQVAFLLVGLFFTLAMLAVLRSGAHDAVARGTQWKRSALAVLAGAAATYSLANGIIVWPIMILMAVLNRCRRNIIVCEAISGLLVGGSYLYGYKTGAAQNGPFYWMRHVKLITVYVVNYLGAPMNFGHLRLALVFGGVAFAAALLMLWRILFRSDRQPFLLLLASLLLFVLGSAVMTSLGRLRFGTDQALSSRYSTVALLLWLSLAVWLLRLVSQRSTLAFVVVQAGLLLIIAFGAARLKYPMRQGESRKLHANTASLAMLTGVFDQQALAGIYPMSEIPWRQATFLKQEKLSIFATALARNLNQPLSAVYHMRPESCWGEVTTAESIVQSAGSGLRLSGWAWDSYRHEAVKEIVFTAGGRIIGYATPGIWRPDLSVRLGSRTARRAGWIGYVAAIPQNTIVAAYATVKSGFHEQACPLVHAPAGPNDRAGGPVSFPAHAFAQ
ncbi:MAG TPA: hypothetical protein VJP83_07955 [Terriglobales bacterium]|nr:hypothetical protein [Terriglobales bacterium]